ncbi:MAG: hypothetical protein GF335_02060 [Candidatus Moranbacteria bacterium]|nr:hypothetical protein [Candidatus Moranbacteria bacterium]
MQFNPNNNDNPNNNNQEEGKENNIVGLSETLNNEVNFSDNLNSEEVLDRDGNVINLDHDSYSKKEHEPNNN